MRYVLRKSREIVYLKKTKIALNLKTLALKWDVQQTNLAPPKQNLVASLETTISANAGVAGAGTSSSPAMVKKGLTNTLLRLRLPLVFQKMIKTREIWLVGKHVYPSSNPHRSRWCGNRRLIAMPLLYLIFGFQIFANPHRYLIADPSIPHRYGSQTFWDTHRCSLFFSKRASKYGGGGSSQAHRDFCPDPSSPRLSL